MPKRRMTRANRQCKNDGQPSKKRQRLELTKITDINDDCLDHIFKAFNLKNLYSVAVANEWLRPAANEIYRRKFGACKVRLYSVHTVANPRYPIHKGDRIIISHFETCIRFLRCFGSSIKHLAVHYRESDSHRYAFVHHYINKYCSENLRTIRFNLKPAFGIEQFDKPFVNVQTVQMFSVDLGEQIGQLSKWFPNAQHVNVNGIEIVHRFNHADTSELEHLTLNVNGVECKNAALKRSCLVNLLKSSRHLQTLNINIFEPFEQTTMDSLLDMIKDSQAISMLTVKHVANGWMPKETKVNALDIMRFVQQHPEVVELDLSYYLFEMGNVIEIIGHLTLLKQFRFGVCDEQAYLDLCKSISEMWQCEYHTLGVFGSFVTMKRQH